ncbi:AT hook domain-containing protein [Colletotrichum limetticola]|uniref:AT hook domain-containing protein n=1 Tax=Colletotrichum limetticola TaxID=1209924 RepID=A0ABQ9PU01_9PEZI|nr:AT hook domain-containing protein [Colletotrichum limetticola]
MAPTVEEPVKRGRGRPPKADGQKKTPYVPTGRPRGRPKGSGGVKKTVAPSTTGTKTRGRPKKADDATAATPKKSATPKKATPKSTGAGGRRGRPRKSDAAATPKAESAKKGKAAKEELPADSDSEDDLSPSGSCTSMNVGSLIHQAQETKEDAAMKSPSDAADSAEEVRPWLPSRMIRGIFG